MAWKVLLIFRCCCLLDCMLGGILNQLDHYVYRAQRYQIFLSIFTAISLCLYIIYIYIHTYNSYNRQLSDPDHIDENEVNYI